MWWCTIKKCPSWAPRVKNETSRWWWSTWNVHLWCQPGMNSSSLRTSSTGWALKHFKVQSPPVLYSAPLIGVTSSSSLLSLIIGVGPLWAFPWGFFRLCSCLCKGSVFIAGVAIWQHGFLSWTVSFIGERESLLNLCVSHKSLQLSCWVLKQNICWDLNYHYIRPIDQFEDWHPHHSDDWFMKTGLSVTSLKVSSLSLSGILYAPLFSYGRTFIKCSLRCLIETTVNDLFYFDVSASCTPGR